MSNYARRAVVEVMEMEGEKILLNQDTFTVTKLNETGGFVWDTLSEKLSFHELAEKLCGEFQMERDTVESDLRSFLRQMTEIGLIRLEE